MTEIRVMPLPKVHGTWIHDSSKYPDVVRIPMSDGKVIRYRIDIDQPHPQLLEAIENIRNMKRAGDAATSPGRKHYETYRGHCTTESEEK